LPRNATDSTKRKWKAKAVKRVIQTKAERSARLSVEGHFFLINGMGIGI